MREEEGEREENSEREWEREDRVREGNSDEKS